MSKTLLFETKSVLSELKQLRKAIVKHSHSLRDYNSLSLVNSFHKGTSNQQYYLRQKGVPGKVYIKRTDAALVEKIKAAHYYKKLLQVIDTDIKLLEAVNKEYIIPEHDSINKLLPKVYRNESPPAAMHVSPNAKEWKERMEAEKAKRPLYRPEELTYRAQDGTMMRSLSEVIIANYLLSLGITFVYELPFTHRGKMVLPDFAILSPVDNRTVIIIEHQGAMGSEEYQSKFIKTLLFYLGTKMVPNKDVFFTFSHLDRNLDLRQVDYILHAAFGCNLPKPEDSRKIN